MAVTRNYSCTPHLPKASILFHLPSLTMAQPCFMHARHHPPTHTNCFPLLPMCLAWTLPVARQRSCRVSLTAPVLSDLLPTANYLRVWKHLIRTGLAFISGILRSTPIFRFQHPGWMTSRLAGCYSHVMGIC